MGILCIWGVSRTSRWHVILLFKCKGFEGENGAFKTVISNLIVEYKIHILMMTVKYQLDVKL